MQTIAANNPTFWFGPRMRRSITISRRLEIGQLFYLRPPISPLGTGIYASLGGYLGLTIGWVKGFELNLLGAI